MYYWVNQGKNYEKEKARGYLRAPLKNTQEKSVFHWENMSKLKPNDIVFNYYKGDILGYCIIISESYEVDIQSALSEDVKKGLMADAEYHIFQNRINIKLIHDEISSFFTKKYSPLNRLKSANQGYLYEINNDLAKKLFSITDVDMDTIPKVEEVKGKYSIPNATSRKGLVTSRIGQGVYRRKILERWNHQCPITQSNLTEILIASHIVPWRDSNDQERLDVNNGILLSPTYDALFDKNYISFKNNGKIILSDVYSEDKYRKLGVTGTEMILNLSEGNKVYLKRHREKLYKIKVN